ncbi:DUF2796 domain-containing protein [Gilvimarinus sp. DA14]|uniref:ZrgA family zinc uptake protein n=1 Tax=Gilvimarinus sp. DA14 TaxID=2956798 RepID=UPI0020B6D4E6|nr:DUF2796 domain-containing protein [Gilvimarinus sp. DA14]UTF61809.1 DUF2796 domain-containing protein [Gilvimarinus sp. DA14]
MNTIRTKYKTSPSARASVRALLMAAILSSAAGAIGAGMPAHTHGEAELTIVLANNTLDVELMSPSVNLVGFEHKANSTDEKALLAQTEQQLQRPDTFLDFTDHQCELVNSSIDVSALQAEIAHSDHTHEHEHSEHDHRGGHSEIGARYRYRCEAGAYPEEIKVKLFQHYPSLSKVNLMWISPSAQGGATLTPKSATASFK